MGEAADEERKVQQILSVMQAKNVDNKIKQGKRVSCHYYREICNNIYLHFYSKIKYVT